MDLKGKVAVVTGGASGIGRECVSLFIEEGATIALLDSHSEQAGDFAADIKRRGGNADVWIADVSDETQIKKVAADIAGRRASVDILLCSAGIAVRNCVAEQDVESWDRCFSINVKGTFLCAKHFIPHMRAKGGSIVNISSVTGLVGVRNRSAYGATKGAILALTRNMALDYASFGIRVNCICPGFTETPLIAPLLANPDTKRMLMAMHPLGRLGTPRDIANAAVFLASDKSSWITGQALAVDGGFTAGANEDV